MIAGCIGHLKIVAPLSAHTLHATGSTLRREIDFWQTDSQSKASSLGLRSVKAILIQVQTGPYHPEFFRPAA